jgi:hypothetical protein
MLPVSVVVVADKHGDRGAQRATVAHAAQELDLILLYLLATAPAVTLLPAGEIPIDVLREQPESRWDPVYQRHLTGAVRFPRRRKTKPQERLRALTTCNFFAANIN